MLQLEHLILNTQLTTDQVTQIRKQLAVLAPPPTPPAPLRAPSLAPAPVPAPSASVEPTPASAPAPAADVAASNPLQGIDLSLLSQLSATGALASLFTGNGSSSGGTPAPEIKAEVKEEVKPDVAQQQSQKRQEVFAEKEDDAAGLWLGEVMRMGVGLTNADVAMCVFSPYSPLSFSFSVECISDLLPSDLLPCPLLLPFPSSSELKQVVSAPKPPTSSTPSSP